MTHIEEVTTLLVLLVAPSPPSPGQTLVTSSFTVLGPALVPNTRCVCLCLTAWLTLQLKGVSEWLVTWPS